MTTPIQRFPIIDPATGETILEYVGSTTPELIRSIERAEDEWRGGWRLWSYARRAECLVNAAAILRERADEYAKLIVSEMGKPVSQARGGVLKCAGACELIAERAEEWLAERAVALDDDGGAGAFVTPRPLGIVLAIMPWNFPFWQVFRAAAPSLMAGNAVALKHAPNTFGCALAIESIFREAGAPDHAFLAPLIGVDQAAELIEHPAIQGVTFTGSPQGGSKVAALAGRELKKVVLELGGSDPYLVLEDADLDHAAETCVKARMQNNGQTCIAAKRFVVVEAVADAFEEKVVALAHDYVPREPLDANCQLGPLARADLRDKLAKQVERTLAGGAERLHAGPIPDGGGFWHPAMVLRVTGDDTPATREELFGPVAVVRRVADEGAAIREANDTRYGLGAAVFTRDLDRARRIARHELDAGAIAINDFVRSDPRLPFGGVKQSGHGRELGREGIWEFVNVKSVAG